MNFTDNYRTAVETNDEARIAELEATAWDYAYELACELDSPNSPDFERTREAIYERLLS